MPNEDNKILKYIHGEKSMKAPFIMYTDLECLNEKMHLYQNNLEKYYTEKKELCMKLLVIRCLQIAYFAQENTNLIDKEVKTV